MLGGEILRIWELGGKGFILESGVVLRGRIWGAQRDL